MIFVLAAGKQTRWEGNEFKQLLPVGDTTIIERTVWQLATPEYPRAYRIINKHVPLNTIFPQGKILYPLRTRFTSETLLSTIQEYDRRDGYSNHVVLLGDVIYSHATLDRILKCTEPIRWYGNLWEIFALSFSVAIQDKVIAALKKTITQAETPGIPKDHLGKLRNFYHNYCGIDQQNDTEHPLFGKVCSINDYTNDVDSREEYISFLKQHLGAMIQDDRNYG